MNSKRLALFAALLLASPAYAQDIQNPVQGANPSATIGAAAVNGTAQTFMRSDAAPPLPATLPALDGSALTNLNATALVSGTVANARINVAPATCIATLNFGGAHVGFAATTTCFYVQTSRGIRINVYELLSAKGSSTGSVTIVITGLPTVALNSANVYQPVSIYNAAMTTTGVVQGYVTANTATIQLSQTTVLGVQTALADTNFTNATELMIGLTLLTDS